MFVGMGTVMLSLYLLSLFLRLTGKLFGPDSKRGDSSAEHKEKNKTGKVIKEKGLDRARVAAITAAVYQVLDKKQYRIISIKRANTNWKK